MLWVTWFPTVSRNQKLSRAFKSILSAREQSLHLATGGSHVWNLYKDNLLYWCLKFVFFGGHLVCCVEAWYWKCMLGGIRAGAVGKLSEDPITSLVLWVTTTAYKFSLPAYKPLVVGSSIWAKGKAARGDNVQSVELARGLYTLLIFHFPFRW